MIIAAAADRGYYEEATGPTRLQVEGYELDRDPDGVSLVGVLGVIYVPPPSSFHPLSVATPSFPLAIPPLSSASPPTILPV